MYLWIGMSNAWAMSVRVCRARQHRGGDVLGATKRSAAEFSCCRRSRPMVGAFFDYDFYRNRGEMTTDHPASSRWIIRGYPFITAMIRGDNIFELRPRNVFQIFPAADSA